MSSIFVSRFSMAISAGPEMEVKNVLDQRRADGKYATQRLETLAIRTLLGETVFDIQRRFILQIVT